MSLQFNECHTKIRHVDAHATLNDGVVVQVLGELSNNGQPMRKFMQTFVLAPEVSTSAYVYIYIMMYNTFGDIKLWFALDFSIYFYFLLTCFCRVQRQTSSMSITTSSVMRMRFLKTLKLKLMRVS